MNTKASDFSNPQWEFLALLDALGDLVSIDVASELVPLTHSAFLTLIEKSMELGWLTKTDTLEVGLKGELPPYAKEKIEQINTEKRYSDILNQIKSSGLHPGLPQKALSNIMRKSGQSLEAALLEYELAQAAIRDNRYHEAIDPLNKVVLILKKHLGEHRYDELFIKTILNITKAYEMLDKDLSEIIPLLQEGCDIAIRLGDQRDLTLIKLYISWCYIHEFDLKTGLPRLGEAIEEVNKIGDYDILVQTKEFFGIYYFFQGLYKDAAGYFEQALQAEAAGYKMLISKLLPMLMAYSSIIVGQIERAVGVLDCAWHRAEMIQDENLATFYRTGLGLMLVQWGDNKKALPHLHAGLLNAQAQNNYWALVESLIGLSLHLYSEGRFQEAYDYSVQCLSNVVNSVRWGHHPIWPRIIEMFFAFGKMGFDPLPNFIYEKEIDRYLNGPNIHLRGLALYMLAEEALQNQRDPKEIRSNLEKSLADLQRSGDIITQAKCAVALTRLNYQEGNIEEAKKFALQAWEILSGYGQSTFTQEIFPDTLKPLLGISSLTGKSQTRREDLLEKFIEHMDEFLPTTEEEALLSRLITSSTRFFESERGGLFIIEGGQPVLYAGYNLTRKEVTLKGFRYNLEQIMKTHKNGQPLILKPRNIQKDGAPTKVLSILCLPFEYKENVNGVLYHDTSYMDKPYEALDRTLLMKISRHLSQYTVQIRNYFQNMQNKVSYASEICQQNIVHDDQELKYQCPVMNELLLKATQAAESEAPILILGETGVGKELLARQIHAMSPRKDGPFIVVDLTSVPETLVESELFGYEKGAFTGADRQKKGRIELADGGTLFIDEVGDIPKSTQVKLLRTLQEKTISRVGGTRTIPSNFRLLAATNRDLMQDVQNGDFREDLYYRLNVVPLNIPPLRERGNEVVFLAQHFLDLFAKKYRRPHLHLAAEDKSKLRIYSWPGNVRELKNIIERSVIMSNTDRPELILQKEAPVQTDNPFTDKPTLEEMQRRYIRFILDQTNGRISGPGGAAEILGMKRTSVYTRMKKLGMSV